MNTFKKRALALSLTLKKLYTDDHAQVVAWWLLEKVTKKTKALLLISSDSLSENQEITLKEWEDLLLIKQYPLQYILETVPFGPLELFVESPILIPRPETEAWCSDVIEMLLPYKNEHLTLLDMCSGSGCIGLWIASTFPNATVYGVDISEQAINLARKNAQHNNVKNIIFIHSDLFTNIPKNITYDIIIANPPYITEQEWLHLEPQVKEWEDKKALVADDNGLALYQKITTQSLHFLNKNTVLNKTFPHIIFEIGQMQAKDVKTILEKSSYTNITVKKDSAGKDRVVFAKIKGFL